jgi:hypothetical protein
LLSSKVPSPSRTRLQQAQPSPSQPFQFSPPCSLQPPFIPSSHHGLCCEIWASSTYWERGQETDGSLPRRPGSSRRESDLVAAAPVAGERLHAGAGWRRWGRPCWVGRRRRGALAQPMHPR